MLGVSDQTIRRLLKRGVLASVPTVGGHSRVVRQSVVDYLAKAGVAIGEAPTPLPPQKPKAIKQPTPTAPSSVEQRLAERLRGTR